MQERFPEEHKLYDILSPHNISEEMLRDITDDTITIINTINERKKKFKNDSKEIISLYESWMDNNLRIIPLKKVNNSLRRFLKIPVNIPKNEQEGVTYSLKAFSAFLECLNFGIYIMNMLLDRCDEISLNPELSKEQKAYEIEKNWFIFDYFRVFYRIKTNGIEKINFRYKNRVGDILDTTEIYYEIDALTFPNDLRVLRLVFEVGRLGIKKDGFEWGINLCHEYIITVLKTTFKNNFENYGFKFNTLILNISLGITVSPNVVIEATITLLSDYIDEFQNICIEPETVQKIDTKNNTLLSELYSKKSVSKNKMFIESALKIVTVIDLLIAQLDNVKKNRIEIKGLNSENIEDYKNTLFRFECILLSKGDNSFSNNEDLSKFRIVSIEDHEKHLESLNVLCDIWEEIVDTFDYSGELTLLMKKTQGIKRIIALIPYPNVIKERIDDILNQMILNIQRAMYEIVATPNEDIITLLKSNSVIRRFYEDNNLKEFLIMVTSAEHLYHLYIEKRQAYNMDYSFIAILYYKSLESLLNVCFYHPLRDMLAGRYVKESEFIQYFAVSSLNYITHGAKNQRIMNTNLELGKLQNVLMQTFSEKKPIKTIEYIKETLKIDENRLLVFISHLSYIRKGRNKAAHPTVISYEEARTIKENVYYFNPDSINDYRGMVAEFINLLGSRDSFDYSI